MAIGREQMNALKGRCREPNTTLGFLIWLSSRRKAKVAVMEYSCKVVNVSTSRMATMEPVERANNPGCYRPVTVSYEPLSESHCGNRCSIQLPQSTLSWGVTQKAGRVAAYARPAVEKEEG